MDFNNLMERTQKFWKASLAYNGNSSESMTTSAAIRYLGDAFDSLNPERPLFQQATDLQWDIIQGKCSRSRPTRRHNNHG